MTRTVETAYLKAWITATATLLSEHREYLCDLDSATGDADHGSNMHRGFAAVMGDLESGEGETPGALLKRVGLTLVDHIGGSSGALYGTFFLRMAKSVGPEPALTADGYVQAWRAAAVGVSERGDVVMGDKTLYDALEPAVDAMERAASAGADLGTALRAAAVAANDGADATADLVARRGRASYLGGRSLGHPDAGAHSMALVVRAAADVLS